MSPQEEHVARSRLCGLAERLTAAGTLRSAQWRAVFQRTWRHPYVPRYYPDHGAAPPVGAADGEQRRAEWLAAVYSDESLITKMVPTPLRKNGWFTSSSTMPSLMLTMLEALDITDGCRVLEIGTGSGYNAALLCERLGGEYVTSVDIDPELIELASARLAAHGYHPTLATVDGAGGYPPGAPYDRIIATCSVPAVPAAWLDQTAPGGMIMADVRGPLGGTVVRLTMNDEGTATGRFLPHYWSFMLMRPGAEEFPPVRPQPAMTAEDAVHSVSDVDPELLHSNGHVGFVTQWHLPGVTFRYAHGDDGQTGIQLDAPDGSIARAWHAKNDKGVHVQQTGPCRLWDRVEDAVTFWHQAGRPNYDRFGVTATASDQFVWYDHPESQHRWRL
ncbi:MAG: methyltransferase domain-containing protein [Pseudonocardiaceae bacterium]